MINLSTREKKLIYLLMILIGSLFWYKTFNNILMPKYKYYSDLLKEQNSATEKFAQIKFEQEFQEVELAKFQEELISLKQLFPQTSGFLLSTLGELATGKFDILKTEHISIEDENYYQVRSIQIKTRGELKAILDYLKGLEDRVGIQVNRADFMLKEGETGLLVESDFLIKQYFIPKNEEEGLMEPSTTYLPYLYRDLGEQDLQLEERNSGLENQLGNEANPEEIKELQSFKLAPYSFPIL